MTDTPAARKRGSASAPGICRANSGGNAPWTTDTWTPIFSNRRPRSIAIRPPPPGAPLASVRDHGSRVNRPGARSAPTPANSRSSVSIALMILALERMKPLFGASEARIVQRCVAHRGLSSIPILRSKAKLRVSIDAPVSAAGRAFFECPSRRSRLRRPFLSASA